jgi:hypothetical protein
MLMVSVYPGLKDDPLIIGQQAIGIHSYAVQVAKRRHCVDLAIG